MKKGAQNFCSREAGRKSFVCCYFKVYFYRFWGYSWSLLFQQAKNTINTQPQICSRLQCMQAEQCDLVDQCVYRVQLITKWGNFNCTVTKPTGAALQYIQILLRRKHVKPVLIIFLRTKASPLGVTRSSSIGPLPSRHERLRCTIRCKDVILGRTPAVAKHIACVSLCIMFDVYWLELTARSRILVFDFATATRAGFGG